MKKQIKNRGVILGQSSLRTYLGGSIPYEVRVEDGNWTPWLPRGEKQAGKDDWFDCVSRSLTNSVEIQEKRFTGIEVNYSDRFLAKRSETTRQGNYLDKVAETARKDGLVFQELYPDTEGTWEEQYSDLDPSQLSSLLFEGSKWHLKWEIKYEVIPVTKDSLQYHLKHAPLQLVIPGHAIVGVYSNKNIEKVFDSYIPFVKDIPSYYYSSKPIYAMKIVLYKKEEALDPDILFENIKYGQWGDQVLKLKRALNRLGWTTGLGDLYDTRLATVVYNFQLANLPRSSWSFFWAVFYYKGKFVDETTRSVINKSLPYKK